MSELLTPEGLAFLMFGATMVALILGFPVALTLSGVALLFAYLGKVTGVSPIPMALINTYPLRIFGTMKNELLVAIPMFIFMGVMLEKSNLAARLLETMGRAFGRMNGGLGISVIVVGALLAASTGIVGATVVTMGVMSLPVMLRAGYDPRLATGIINASGTLGQIIPPSIVLVLLADQLQEANEKAAEKVSGSYVPDPVTAIDLFAGALLPGFLLVFLYMGYQMLLAAWKPDTCPPLTNENQGQDGQTSFWEAFKVILPPLILIVLVLGSILAGAATPTEAAAVGAVGATVLAALSGMLSFGVIGEVSRQTVKVTSMVFLIIIGAQMLSLVFTGFGGTQVVEDFLNNLPGGQFAAMLLVMAVIFFLGFFLDFIEIILIVVPIVGPILIFLGLDPLWLGVMIGINLQTSFLTPPFGFALFYLRGVAPDSVLTSQIYRGVVPFIGIQLLALAIIWLFPQIVTWLPSVVG